MTTCLKKIQIKKSNKIIQRIFSAALLLQKPLIFMLGAKKKLKNHLPFCVMWLIVRRRIVNNMVGCVHENIRSHKAGIWKPYP